jgi:hypothetical protein
MVRGCSAALTTDTVRVIGLLFFASHRGGSRPSCLAGNEDPMRWARARAIQQSCLANQLRLATAQYHAKMTVLFSPEIAES